MTNESSLPMDDGAIELAAPPDCSHCGFPILGSYSGLRHYGTHMAHQESECLQLLHAELARLRDQVAGAQKLAAFGAWCARAFRDSLADVDGGSADDAMERTGVLVKRFVTQPCGEDCKCAGYGDFPHDCYVFPADVVEAMGMAHE